MARTGQRPPVQASGCGLSHIHLLLDTATRPSFQKGACGCAVFCRNPHSAQSKVPVPERETQTLCLAAGPRPRFPARTLLCFPPPGSALVARHQIVIPCQLHVQMHFHSWPKGSPESEVRSAFPRRPATSFSSAGPRCNVTCPGTLALIFCPFLNPKRVETPSARVLRLLCLRTALISPPHCVLQRPVSTSSKACAPGFQD